MNLNTCIVLSWCIILLSLLPPRPPLHRLWAALPNERKIHNRICSSDYNRCGILRFFGEWIIKADNLHMRYCDVFAFQWICRIHWQIELKIKFPRTHYRLCLMCTNRYGKLISGGKIKSRSYVNSNKANKLSIQ